MNKNKERSLFIKSLVDIFNKNGLTGLDFKDGELEVKLKKELPTTANVPVAFTAPAPAPQLELESPSVTQADPVVPSSDDTNHPGAVKSPTVGVVYLKTAPDKPDLISVGSTVSEGDTLFLLEVMKVFTPIKAHKSGTIKKILVENQSIVEYNEVLAIIE